MFDPLLLKYGIVTRLKPELIFEGRNRNGNMNRYLLYMTSKLLKLKGNQTLYWKYAYWFLTNSNSYLLVCLWNIDKNCYRTMFKWDLVKLIRKVHDLRGSKFAFPPSVLMDYHRTYVPKGTDSWRPLGVPTLAWRVYGNMLLHILVMSMTINDTQHGFIPQRGTLTAWKDILSKVVKSPFIYETDLKQCFPSINLFLLVAVLTRRGVPLPVAKFYASINYRIMRLPKLKDQKLNEAQFNTLKSAHKLNIASSDVFARDTKECMPWPYVEEWNSNTYYSESRMLTQKGDQHIPKVETGLPRDVLTNFLIAIEYMDNMGDHKKHFEPLWAALAKSQDDPIRIPLHKAELLKFIGTAQGSPLSPFLSAIVIDEVDKLLPRGVKILKYADDWIFYGSKKLRPFVEKGVILEVLQQLGFTINSDKSGWIRKDWKWVNRLKFLGLVLIGGRIFASETRKGNALIFNEKENLINESYDMKFALKTNFDRLVKLYWTYYNRGVKVFTVDLLGVIFSFPVVIDVIAFNLSHHYKELIHFKAASEDNEHLWKILLFLRFMMSLPRKILLAVKFKRLLLKGDKQASLAFVKEVFDSKGSHFKVSLAEDHHDPQVDSSRKLLFHEEAPYLMKPNIGWSPYTKQKSDWRTFFKGYEVPVIHKEVPPGIHFNKYTGSPEYLNYGVSNVLADVNRDTSVSTQHSTLEEIFPLWRYRTLFFTEYNNQYLRAYRNRYTFDNLVKSELFGLIQARMYAGTWINDEIVQNFKFKYRGLSLADQLVTKYGKSLNSFNGTSFAFAELSRILKRYSKITVMKHNKTQVK